MPDCERRTRHRGSPRRRIRAAAGVVPRRALLGHRHLAPRPVRVHGHEQVHRAVAAILVIDAVDLAGRGRDGLAHLAMLASSMGSSANRLGVASADTTQNITFTANIAFLFPDLPFLDRIDAAKAAGRQGRMPFPLRVPAARAQGAARPRRCRAHRAEHAAGRPRKGKWGFAGVPGREDQFRRDFAQAVSYATALGAAVIHVMAVIGPRRAAKRRGAPTCRTCAAPRARSPAPG